MNSLILNRFGFNERDILRLSTAPNNQKIDSNSIPTFVLGTILNVIESTYCNTPIFNLKNLDEKGLLDLNKQSASQDDLCIKMTSNKTAATTSSKVSYTAKAACNFGGIIAASGSFHNDQSLSMANSDGNVYVSMQRGKSGSYYQINTKDLASGIDLTPYLIGTRLTDKEMEQYISYKEMRFGKQKYVSEITFGGYEGSGLMDWGLRNMYGNFQLLTRMEELFAHIVDQYSQFKDNKEIKKILWDHLNNLKYKKINHVIRDFYAHVGTHFVNKLYFSSYAYGYGTLKFSETAGNEETRYGAALSLNGSIDKEIGLEAGGDVSFARKKGWASSMKNLTIEAHSRPADVVDIGKFASDIKGILSDEGKELSVPTLSVPESPKVELLDKPKVEEKKLGPPDCVFSSYDDWKKYQAEIKKDEKGNNKNTEKINEAKKDLETKGSGLILEKDPEEPESSIEAQQQYRELLHELNLLHEKRNQRPQPASDDNVLRIEDMFVSGFESTEYEAVIPSLRVNKLVLPDWKEEIDAYPNISKLFLVINLFQQAADYMEYISNFSVSNVSKEFASKVQSFTDQFAEGSNIIITTWMSKGNDIPTSILNTLGDDWFENKGSKLYIVLGDSDWVGYVKYILKPEVMHLWRDAPGGYAPFFFEKSFKPAFVELEQVVAIKEEGYPIHCNCRINYDFSKALPEMPDDISEFYHGRTESPLYPVFRYEHKNEAKFVFMQMAGRYQLIYGRNGVIHPLTTYCAGDTTGPVDLNKNTLSNMVPDLMIIEGRQYTIDAIPTMDKTITNLLMPIVEGFKIDKINREYALYFPDKTQTKELWEKSRVLIMDDYNSDKEIKSEHSPRQYFYPDGKTSSDRCVYYNFSNLYYSVIQQFEDKSGYVVKVEDGSKRMLHFNEKFPLLMPIDYSKISSENGSLLMGSSFGASNLIDSSTYNVAATTSIHVSTLK